MTSGTNHTEFRDQWLETFEKDQLLTSDERRWKCLGEGKCKEFTDKFTSFIKPESSLLSTQYLLQHFMQ